MKWSLLSIVVSMAPFAAFAAPKIPAECHPGRDPQERSNDDYAGGLSRKGGGLTPASVPGATTVSAAEAKCLIDKLGEAVLVIAAVNDNRKLPRAVTAAGFGSGDPDPEFQQAVADALKERTKGDKKFPIITYCHHIECFLSYNAALRLVQAGYTNVFWMRSGLDGWKKAGFAFSEPEKPKVPQGLTEKYLEELNDDRSLKYDVDAYVLSLGQHESPVEFEATFKKTLEEHQADHRNHLEYLKREFEGNAAAIADADKRLATADADVQKLFEQVRAEFEANPVKYLAPGLDGDIAKLKQQLALAKNMKSLEESCGTFDFRLPPLDNEVIRARRAEWKRYADCITRYRDDKSFVLAEIEFSIATEYSVSTRFYTCSRRPGPNCVPDELWARQGNIATPENRRIVKAADALSSQRYEVNALIRRLNQWAEDLNDAVEQYNSAH